MTLSAVHLEATAELAASLSRPVTTASQLAPGLHPDFPHDAYHYRELGMVSNTAIDHVRRSPAHYLAWVSGAERPEETKPFAFGSALHMRCLEPERFARTYLVEPYFGPCRKNDVCSSEDAKKNKTRRDAWRAQHVGATILDGETGAATLGMIESIANHPIARPLLDGGDAELTLRWDDPETGLACKARADKYREDLGCVVDLKSAVDASPDAFRRSVANYGYVRQAAHYRDGFGCLGPELDHFDFVVAEKAAPYAVAVYSLDREALALGQRQVERARRTLAGCLRRNEWPGYPQSIKTLQLPAWVKDDE